jgi:hypothetical protein
MKAVRTSVTLVYFNITTVHWPGENSCKQFDLCTLARFHSELLLTILKASVPQPPNKQQAFMCLHTLNIIKPPVIKCTTLSQHIQNTVEVYSVHAASCFQSVFSGVTLWCNTDSKHSPSSTQKPPSSTHTFSPGQWTVHAALNCFTFSVCA